eukprot:GHVU01005798.1.p1 GENE.GHVU01005798.1~~GHVU01005798.1.p1  ORF type:complete len:395 (+),score=63.07 GHVU01005798.1:670-1854(+)
MCQSCYDNFERCFACERKVVPVSPAIAASRRQASNSSNMGAGAVPVCERCRALNLVFDDAQARECLNEVLTYYSSYLGLVFTENMLRYQEFLANGKHQQVVDEMQFNANLQKRRNSTPAAMSGADAGNYSRRQRCGSDAIMEQLFKESSDKTRSHRYQTIDTVAGLLPLHAVSIAALNERPGRRTAATHSKFAQCDQSRFKYGDNCARFVDKILVANSLPKCLFAAHLAHELMHAWLHMAKVDNLRPDVEEGLCNSASVLFMRSLVLQYDKWGTKSPNQRSQPSFPTSSPPQRRHSTGGAPPGAAARPQFAQPPLGAAAQTFVGERSLLAYSERKLLDNPDPVYGEGLRRAIAAMQQHSVQAVLRYLVDNSGELPPTNSSALLDSSKVQSPAAV